MTDIDLYTEYGVFVAHGSAEVLHKTFRTGGHDLVVSMGDCEFYGACTCGKPLGSIKPDKSLDELGLAWERHVMTEVRGLSIAALRGALPGPGVAK